MYHTIMVPVDLQHADKLEKALATGADLAKFYGAAIHMVGVTASEPSSVAHNPSEFARKFQAFADEQSAKRGVSFIAREITSHDPTIDLDEHLDKAADEIGADLIVMASHIPGIADYIFSSRAGFLASHTDKSVFVVR